MNDMNGRRDGPLGIQVTTTAYAFQTGEPLSNTTFLSYRIRYAGTAPIDDAYVGFFIDTYDFDWFGGSDTTLSMAYKYGPNDVDADGAAIRPPAFGLVQLRESLNGSAPRSSSVSNSDARSTPNPHAIVVSPDHYLLPSSPEDYYNVLRGVWRDGGPITVGGFGWAQMGPAQTTKTETTYMFPGDPITSSYWSMEKMDLVGTPWGCMHHDGRRCGAIEGFVVSSGPYQIEQDDVLEIVFALVWSGGEDRFDSIRNLRKSAGFLHKNADALLSPATDLVGEENPSESSLAFAQNYPNPFFDQTTIRFSVPHRMHVQLSIFDTLGRRTAILVDDILDSGSYTEHFVANDLPAGVYFAQINLGYLHFTKPMVLAR
jgi:hypothetical protein